MEKGCAPRGGNARSGRQPAPEERQPTGARQSGSAFLLGVEMREESDRQRAQLEWKSAIGGGRPLPA